MRYVARLSAISLLLILTLVSCRPPYPVSIPTPVPEVQPPVLSPTYQVDSYKDLVERNWSELVEEPPILTFTEFEAAVDANRLPSEDAEDVYATIFAIASQYAFVQQEPLRGDHFVIAARLVCWWHPPGSPPPLAEWTSRRPYVISNAAESELARLRLAARVDPSIYTMRPNDVLELLRTENVESFLEMTP